MKLPEPAFENTPDGKAALIRFHVQPRSSREAVAGDWNGEAVKINLAAPPVDGKANAALIKFLASALKVPRSAIALARGETSHNKVIRVSGKNASEIKHILENG